MSLPSMGVPRICCSFPRVSGDEPFKARSGAGGKGFPRVSGDEPGVSAPISAAVVFSPRERG